uniref:Uncharacterized protein n=1 Tax=Nitrosopumivirus cobalaminus TaxID=3158414 RepID=A0AAU7N5Z3_9VIRU
MVLGERNYAKIRVFKQSDINLLPAASDGAAQDPVNATVSYQSGYNSSVFSNTPQTLNVSSLTITKGINTNLGGCTVVVTNGKDFVTNGMIDLGFNEFIEIRFSQTIDETSVSNTNTWFRGYIQKVKYVKINATESDLILEAVGEAVTLKERLTKIDRLRPFGRISRLDESVTPAVHIEETGFLDELYRQTIEYEAANPLQAGVTQFFQQGGFNFDPRTKVLGVPVTAKDSLPASITRKPFQTVVTNVLSDMFGLIPPTVSDTDDDGIPTGSLEYQNPVVSPNETRQLLRLINGGNDLQNIDVILPQFASDYGTILSSIDTLSAAVNAIYYVNNEGHFVFRQSPINTGRIIDVDTNLYNSYSFSDDIVTNGYSTVTGLGFNAQEFNIFRQNSSVDFALTLNRATRWRSAGVPNGSDYNVNSFRRSNNIGIEFSTASNTDISSIELPVIRIGDITSSLQWEIREYEDGQITARYDITGNDSQLILGSGVITATQLNELVPYLYETWADTGNDTDRSDERIDSSFVTTQSNNLTTASQAGLIELPITAQNLRPNTKYMLVIRPPIDVNGSPVNGIPSVTAANGVTENLLFVYNLPSGTPTVALNNLRRWGITPNGLSSNTLFEPTGGLKVLQNSDSRVLQVLTPFNVDTTLGDSFGTSNKSSIPLILGSIPIRVNVERSTVITSENPLLNERYGLREITVPFPSNANADVVRDTIRDIQVNLFNQRNRVYSDFVYEFPADAALDAGTIITIQDNNNQNGIGLNQNILISQITIEINAESGKFYTDRITIKGTQLI